MKILVTGGAGYLGSHTCKALASAGHEVVVYDNLSTGHRHFVRWGDFEYGDIRDITRFGQVLRKYVPDGVIHFAACSQVGESVTDPGLYFSNNVGGTLAILQNLAAWKPVPIVVSGTCAVYGQPEKLPITEDMPKNPISPYGAAKLFMERMLEDFHTAHNIPWISLRYFNAAGASPDGEIGELHLPETHLVPRVISAALGKLQAVDIYGEDYPTADGTCIRDFVHVDDLANAHMLALKRLVCGAPSMALNVGSGRGASVREIIDAVAKITGHAVPSRSHPRRSGDPACLVADATLARQILGWQPERNLDAILRDAFNYLAALP